MVIRILLTSLLLILAACNVAASPAPTPNISGTVDITYPPYGAVIYADQLYAAGMSSGLTEDSFALELVGTDGSIIARYPVPTGNGEWQVE